MTMSWIVPLLLGISCLATSYGLPNIVFVLTDDVDVSLSGLKALNKTKALLVDEGATFEKAFVTTPVCCPSRASILTGLYLHNTGTYNNSVSGNCSSQNWRDGPEKKAFVTYLKQKGYSTFYAGKYLNQYGIPMSGTGVEFIPPGWDDWNGLVGNSKYYNYKLSVNGKAEVHGDDYEKDYLTDVIGRKASEFLNAYSTSGSASPFLMVLATPSAHEPFIPAPQYANEFANEQAPRTPAYNHVEAPGHEKHWLVRTQPRPFNQTAADKIDRIYRDRLRTLLSVDDLVDGILNKITDLNNTYVIFSSDHGYHMGQFGLPYDKRHMYETDIRIPLMIRGPGITGGTKSDTAALSIDLAPTILDMAGIPRPDHMDGKSLLPFITETNEITLDRTDFLVEYHGEGSRGSNDPECADVVDMDNMSSCHYSGPVGFYCKCEDSRNNTYTCLRTVKGEDTVRCFFKDDVDFVEMYNINEDPYQLTNLAWSEEEEENNSEAQSRIAQLRNCHGWRQCLN